MQNKKFLVLSVLSLYSFTASAELDLSFHLNIIPQNNQISILRVQPPAPAPIFSPAFKRPELVEKKILVSPKMLSLPIVRLTPVTPAKVLFDSKAKSTVPTVKALEAVHDPVLKNDSVNISELIEISPEEFKMIQGLVLFELQNKYDLAMSVFAELLDNPKYKIQALYGYAEMAVKLGLNSEYRQKMLQLSKQSEDKFFRKKAVESLVGNAHVLLPGDVDNLDPLISELNVDLSSREGYQLKRAKEYLTSGDLSAAESALRKIGVENDKYVEATLLTANSHYRRGELSAAISVLEKITPKIESKKTDKIRNLIYLTLARMYFQKGNYKSSYATYLKIDKSSSLWLESTTEQALTQILAGDNIGAAGNMFSLHTDYFKKAYAPETYIIRTVGYLNLCQYGDAASALVDLSRRYGKILEQLQAFKAQHSNQNDYYALVKDWFANTDQLEVRSVPRSYIVELARHPNFINLQKQINSFEEEAQKFSGVITGFPAKEQSIRKNINQLKGEVAANKAKKANELQVTHMERKIAALEMEMQLNQKAPQKLEKLRDLAQSRMHTEKEKTKTVAGAVLQKRYNDFLVSLTNILEQKDVLAYEIYSGAGEHLRYQMAGGGVKDRAPATALTPEEKQSYKWKFKGEVWEDEIGHYRSSLTNVCPDQVAKNTGGK